MMKKLIFKMVIVFLAIGGAFLSDANIFASDIVAIPKWFEYNGCDPQGPLNYGAMLTAPRCAGSQSLCAILAEPNMDDQEKPNLNTIT